LRDRNHALSLLETTSRERCSAFLTLDGKPLQAPNKGTVDKPEFVVECDPSKSKWRGSIHGKILRSFIVIGTVMDSPDQGAKDIPVTSASMTEGKLTLKVAAVMGNYSATVSGNKMDGTWTQGGKPMPLVLTKE
jgi:hypothetical protein